MHTIAVNVDWQCKTYVAHGVGTQCVLYQTCWQPHTGRWRCLSPQTQQWSVTTCDRLFSSHTSRRWKSLWISCTTCCYDTSVRQPREHQHWCDMSVLPSLMPLLARSSSCLAAVVLQVNQSVSTQLSLQLVSAASLCRLITQNLRLFNCQNTGRYHHHHHKLI